MTATDATLRHPLQLLSGIIPKMQALADQCGDHEDVVKEIATLRAQRDVLKRDLAAVKQEFAEREAGLKKVTHQASEKAKECERLDTEIREKNALLNSVNAAMNKVRQQVGG
jgi:chromosome segregation ATPase